MNDIKKAAVIGGGFAGVEAARRLSNAGIKVDLYEMKPVRFSPAHKSENLAELVCSNSFKAIRTESAAGLLKAEMKRFDSVCVACAERSAVPAGGALAVDRDIFSSLVTGIIENDENITLIRKEVTTLPTDVSAVIIAAGPLVSDALSKEIARLTGENFLSFYDAAAPVITADSIDMSHAFTQSRYDRGGDDDYINCPMNKEEYELFYNELVNAEIALVHEFDKRTVYEGCMPIEIMAKRGADTIRFGPLKPENRSQTVGCFTASQGEFGGDYVQSRRLSDEFEIRRAETRVLADPRIERRGIRPLRSDAQKYVYRFPETFKQRFFNEKISVRLLCRADNGSRGLYGVGGFGNSRGRKRGQTNSGKRRARITRYNHARRTVSLHKRRDCDEISAHGRELRTLRAFGREDKR